MKVIYKSVLLDIQREIHRAKEAELVIDHIELTPSEFHALLRELPPYLLPVLPAISYMEECVLFGVSIKMIYQK